MIGIEKSWDFRPTTARHPPSGKRTRREAASRRVALQPLILECRRPYPPSGLPPIWAAVAGLATAIIGPLYLVPMPKADFLAIAVHIR